jgi:hypothetical protein
MKQRNIFLLTAFLFAACNGSNRHTPVVASSSAPKSLTKTRSDYMFSKEGREDLVERLYQEQVEKDKSLNDLEEQLSLLNNGLSDSLGAVRDFFEKNKEYYSASDQTAKQIDDSLLRQRILARLEASLAAFDVRKAGLESLASTIEKSRRNIADLHLALKVLTTMKMIEGYQSSDLPSAAPLQHYSAAQQRLRERLRDSIDKK